MLERWLVAGSRAAIAAEPRLYRACSEPLASRPPYRKKSSRRPHSHAYAEEKSARQAIFSRRRTARAGCGDWLGNGKIAWGQQRTFTEARAHPEPSPYLFRSLPC